MKSVDTQPAVDSSAAHTAPSTCTGDAVHRPALVIGLALAAFLAVALYWPTTNVGFLLDDFLHIGYLYKAFHGEPQILLSKFFGGWSYTTDGLASYRPGTSLSLALDYLCWNANAFGYHLSNLLQLAGNTVLVGLLASELCKRYAVRHETMCAVGSALLFACYPLHVESTSWIIGRVDLLCTMFYLASVCCFLRAVQAPVVPVGAALAPPAQLVGKKLWTALSLVSFLAALCCKEMAVTLPVVLGLTTLLLPDPVNVGSGRSLTSGGASAAPTVKKALLNALRVTAPYWLLLAAFAVWRTHAIGTVVGGYGTTNKRAIIQGLQNFVDGATWFKVVHGVTDEYPSPAWLQLFSFGGAVAATCAGVFVMARNRKFASLYAFLIGWLLVALLPAFQILHIFPNLVGSRLFFLSSAPLSILIAVSLAQLPSSITAEKKPHRIWLSACCCSLIALAVAWSILLSINLQPWLDAGKRMANLHKQALEILANSGPEQTILFANLPSDYKGAGLIGRPEFLEIMCKPPLALQDFSTRIITCESILPGPHDWIGPANLKTAIESAGATYIYSDVDGTFAPLKGNLGASELSTKSVPAVQQQDVVWLSQSPLDPLHAQAIAVGFDCPAEKLGHVQLVWRSKTQEWWRCVADPAFVSGNHVVFVPARSRVWTFGLPIEQFGLRMSTPAHITEVSACAGENFEPKLSTRHNQIFVDGSLLTNVAKLQVFVSKPNIAFPEFATQSQPDPRTVEWSTEISGNSGVVKVPKQYRSAARQQVCVLARDAHDQPIGVLSEPYLLQN